MRKKTVSLLILLYCSFVFAQKDNYNLTFEVQDRVTSKLYIFSQFGVNRNLVDSINYISGKAIIDFENQPTGLYILSYQYETNHQEEPLTIAEIDFIFNQEDIHFRVKHNDKKASVDVITSEENKTWQQFKKAESERNDQVKYVFTTKKLFENEKDIIKALRNKLKKENNEQIKLLKNIQRKYDLSFAAKLIYHTSQTVPPFEFDEDEIFVFVSKDLFERCKFDDESLLNSNVYVNIVFNYIISQFQRFSDRNKQEAAVLKSVEQIMLKAEKNEVIKMTMLDFIIDGLTQLKANAALKFLMEKYPESEKCMSNSDRKKDETEIKIGDTLSLEAMSIIESYAPASVKKSTLLIFWASWCPYSEQLRKELMKFPIPDDLNLIIVSLSKSQEQCKSDRALFPEKYNFQCEGKVWDNELVKQTGINSIPNLILIDSSGKVVQIPENLSDLQWKSH